MDLPLHRDASDPMPDDPHPALDPVGRHAIQAIRARLMIDPEWSVDHADGLSWWSHRLRQRFRIEGPIELDGLATWWASFETDVATGLGDDADAQRFVALAANRVGNLYATAVEEGRLFHRARVYFLPETLEHRVALLTDRALLSNTDAHRIAETFVGQGAAIGVDGDALRVDESAHPVNGRRAQPDEMLTVRDAIFVPLGQAEPPPERRPDLEAAGRYLTRADRPDLRVRVVEAHAGHLGAGLLTAGGFARYDLHSGVRHPILGLGMLSLLRLMPSGTRAEDGTDAAWDEVGRTCERLNAAEAHVWRPLLSLGAWVPDRVGERGTAALTHATFHPNATLVPGLGHELAADALQRFVWAAGFVRGGGAGVN
jgi:hypothetical protein